jgi:hypothetical protein
MIVKDLIIVKTFSSHRANFLPHTKSLHDHADSRSCGMFSLVTLATRSLKRVFSVRGAEGHPEPHGTIAKARAIGSRASGEQASQTPD